jgi:hypothetical protein
MQDLLNTKMLKSRRSIEKATVKSMGTTLSKVKDMKKLPNSDITPSSILLRMPELQVRKELRNLLILKLSEVVKNAEAEEQKYRILEEKLEKYKTDFAKAYSEFSKAQKNAYKTWKKNNLPDNADALKELREKRKLAGKEKQKESYAVYTNQIEKLMDPTDHLYAALEAQQESEFMYKTFKLRIEKDQLSSKSVRFSDSYTMIGVYVKQILYHMVAGLQKALDARNAELALSGVKVTSVPSVELVDFDLTKFDKNVYYLIYSSLVDPTNVTPYAEGTPEYSILRLVNRYVTQLVAFDKTASNPVSKEVQIVLARTLVQFINTLCDLIKDRFGESGIHTIQTKLIVSILDLPFRLSKTPHPERPPKQTRPKKVKPAA